MLKFSNSTRVFIFGEAMDMRRGFEHLTSLVRKEFEEEFLSHALFLFLGMNRRRLKLLTFDGTGLVLVTKRLEQGLFQSLEKLREKKELTAKEMALVFAGSHINFPMRLHKNKNVE